MPSQKPRINLTVPDDLNDVLERLSNRLNRPKTKIITDLMIEMKPHLISMLDALEEIDKNKLMARKIAKDFGDDTLVKVTEMTAELAREVREFKND